MLSAHETQRLAVLVVEDKRYTYYCLPEGLTSPRLAEPHNPITMDPTIEAFVEQAEEMLGLAEDAVSFFCLEQEGLLDVYEHGTIL